MLDRLDHPERDRDRVGDDQGDNPVEERDREPRADDVPDRLVVAVGRPEVALEDLHHPVGVADVPGLVEAVVLPQLLQLVLGERHALAHGAADTRGDVGLLRLHDGALERTTGHQARDQEHEDRDPEQRGWQKQQTSEEVPAHMDRAGYGKPARNPIPDASGQAEAARRGLPNGAGLPPAGAGSLRHHCPPGPFPVSRRCFPSGCGSRSRSSPSPTR